MAIVRKINGDVEAILRTKEMVDFLAAQGADPLIMSPEDFLKELEADVVKWAKVVKAAGVTLNLVQVPPWTNANSAAPGSTFPCSPSDAARSAG